MQHRAAWLFVLAAVGLPAPAALAVPDAPRPSPAKETRAEPPAEKDDETPPITAPKSGPEASGFVEMFVAGVLPTEGGPAVVLRDADKTKLLPIWVGASEAHSIQLRLERRRFPRPLTHDLLDAIVHDLGGEILKITLDAMKGETFVGTVFVRSAGHVARYDARASDSIALAVGNGAPIFVSESILERMSSRRPDLDASPLLDDDEEEAAPTPTSDKPPSSIQTL